MIIDETNIDVVLDAHFGYKQYLRISYDLIDHLGLETAAFLSELWWLFRYFEDKEQLTPDGFFYRDRETLEKRTGLSPYKQRKIADKLVESKFIEYKSERQKDGGEKGYYRLNKKNIMGLFCYHDFSKDKIRMFPHSDE